MNNLLKIQIGTKRKGVFCLEHSFAATVAALLLTGSIVFGFYALENHFKPKENEVPVKTEISVPEKAETEKAVLGVFEGRLALFKGESPYPNKVYDFYVRNLPKEFLFLPKANLNLFLKILCHSFQPLRGDSPVRGDVERSETEGSAVCGEQGLSAKQTGEG